MDPTSCLVFRNGGGAVATSYRDRDFPLDVLVNGFFSTPRESLGVVNQSLMYNDEPELMHDINEHLSRGWLAVLEEVVSKVDLDFVCVWEDMAFKDGPLISPPLFREFVALYYLRVTGFLRERDVDIICVDTEGDCNLLTPLFPEAGMTGLYPFEVQAGMDIVTLRKQYPQLLIQGWLDKT